MSQLQNWFMWPLCNQSRHSLLGQFARRTHSQRVCNWLASYHYCISYNLIRPPDWNKVLIFSLLSKLQFPEPGKSTLPLFPVTPNYHIYNADEIPIPVPPPLAEIWSTTVPSLSRKKKTTLFSLSPPFLYRSTDPFLLSSTDT